MGGDFASLSLEVGQRQIWQTIALIGWKAGHFHCLPLHLEFWERGLLKEAAGRNLTSWLLVLGLWCAKMLWVSGPYSPH